MTCNVVYAHQVAGMERKQREAFDDALLSGPEDQRTVQQLLMRFDTEGEGTDGSPG